MLQTHLPTAFLTFYMTANEYEQHLGSPRSLSSSNLYLRTLLIKSQYNIKAMGIT